MNKLISQPAGLLLLFISGFAIALGLSLLIPSMAFAQSGSETTIAPLLGGVLAFLVVIYIFFALTLQIIANKLNVANSWLAWIPIANLWVWVKCAGRPDWWVILFFIPLVNFLVSIITLFDVPVRLNKPALIALLILVPVIEPFLYWGILAFT